LFGDCRASVFEFHSQRFRAKDGPWQPAR
jgi:hypothetical protein